jgi:excisionase family DNA binding protein
MLIKVFRLFRLTFCYGRWYNRTGVIRMPEEEALTVKEAAARLKLNPETVRRWIRSGRIRAVSLGSDKAGFRIPESEVLRLLSVGPAGSSSD